MRAAHPSFRTTPDRCHPSEAENEASDAHFAAEQRRASNPAVKAALREAQVAAATLIRECCEDYFVVLAGVLALDGTRVIRASHVFRLIPEDRGCEETTWLRLELALARFLELQGQTPGRPYQMPAAYPVGQGKWRATWWA